MSFQHAPHLGQLRHERLPCVQPAGCVHDQDVASSGPGGRDRVERHRTRIRASLLRHQVCPSPRGPGLELLACGRPERVAVRHADREALLRQHMGQLSDGRGLPGAVHADHHDDPGRAGRRGPCGIPGEHAGHRAGHHVGGVGRRLVGLANPPDDLLRGLRAHVGADQCLLQFLPGLLGGRSAAKETTDPFAEPFGSRKGRRPVFDPADGLPRRAATIGRTSADRADPRREGHQQRHGDDRQHKERHGNELDGHFFP